MLKFVISLIATSFILISCTGCEDGHKDPLDSQYLDKDYDFIIGILTPDSLRKYPQEIFVGKILDKKIGRPVPEGLDPVVLRVAVTMHHEYLGLVIGREGAIVKVTDQDSNVIIFQEIGNGIYRDVQNRLHVNPMSKYFLSVEFDDTSYTAETSVPGYFDLSNTQANDTMDVVVRWLSHADPTCVGYYDLRWSRSESSYFYRLEHSNSLYNFIGLDHTFIENDAKVAVSFDTTKTPLSTIVEVTSKILSIDSNYGKIYWPGSAWTGSDDFFKYMKSTRWLPLPQRSNIIGTTPVVGVFGSYNQAVRHYYLKPVIE